MKKRMSVSVEVNERGEWISIPCWERLIESGIELQANETRFCLYEREGKWMLKPHSCDEEKGNNEPKEFDKRKTQEMIVKKRKQKFLY